MKIYIAQINDTKLAYPSLERAQSALSRFIQDNPNPQLSNDRKELNYRVYSVELLATQYIAVLINKKTEEHSFIESRLSDTLEEFKEFVEMEYSKDYLFDILPYFCL